MASALPYLMVAEERVLPLLPLVFDSVLRHGEPERISVVVPARQLPIFRSRLGSRPVDLIAEDDVLPEWSLSRVRSMLPRQPGRAGWYLQQFLKLSFGQVAGLERLVVWDADTVMLRKPSYEIDGKTVFNVSREHHAPYFQTYSRLFGEAARLPKSVISQYMMMDMSVIQLMTEAIEARSNEDWVTTVLTGLPQRDISEFSEYETYGNYFASARPTSYVLKSTPWFRYGTDILGSDGTQSLDVLEKQFRRYAHVAFERHPFKAARWLGSHVLLMLGR